MKDINNDVTRTTANAKDLDTWIGKLGGYVTSNPFTTGTMAKETQNVLAGIVQATNISSLPPGGVQELVKGVISENTMHYVTRMGEDMKTDLRKIAVEGYRNKVAPKELAKQMSQKIEGLSRQRAQVIARTETRRAGNISNYVNAKINQGANSFKVISDSSTVCPFCQQLYGDGSIVFDIEQSDVIPPIHPNCNCTPLYSTKTQDMREETNFDPASFEDKFKDLSTPLLEHMGVASSADLRDFVLRNKSCYDMFVGGSVAYAVA
jgi:SPP1 gp7 family putative phage head morphogenesis protein